MECKCGNKEVKYSRRYDAFYCPSCGEWIEDKCSDPYCEYCEGRPDKPFKEWYCK